MTAWLLLKVAICAVAIFVAGVQCGRALQAREDDERYTRRLW